MKRFKQIELESTRLKGTVADLKLNKQVLTEGYRQTYIHTRPHNSLGYRPPAREATVVNSQFTNVNTAPMATVALT